jgi:hypothetical protein
MKERRSDAFFRRFIKADDDDKKDWETTTENAKIRHYESEVSIFIYAGQIEP